MAEVIERFLQMNAFMAAILAFGPAYASNPDGACVFLITACATTFVINEISGNRL